MRDGERAADVALPELTRSLRALGAARWLRDADHARFFTPLLTARRNAARVRTAEGHVAAFQAERLRRALGEAVEQMAAARHPKSAPDQRAFAARVTDAGAALWRALDELEERAADVAKAPAATRRDAWMAWVAVLERLFLAADAWWMAIVELRDGRSARGSTRGGDSGAFKAVSVALLIACAPLALPAQQHLTYRVTGATPNALQAAGFDVVGSEGGAAIVVAAPRDVARLQAMGAQTNLLLAPNTDQRRVMNDAVVAATPTVYRSYDDPVRGIRRWVDSLVAANPSKVSVDTVGKSYEGRPILAVKVGPKGDAASRPNVLFVATHHAREWAATEVALRLIRQLVTATDARTDSLVNNRDIWIVPVVNPDGYQYTFTTDRLWRKNRRPMSGGNVGVDLNRNHATNWGLDNIGSSPDPAAETYRGPSAASEPEVAALQAFHALHPPVISISYHTYAGLLLFPPGAKYGVLAADIDAYRVLGGTNAHSAVTDHLPGSSRSFYSPGTAWLLYPTNGEYTDWASANYGTISINPEVTSGYGPSGYYGFEFPDDETRLQTLFTDNLPFAMDAIEMARAPGTYRSATTGLRIDRFTLESGTAPLRVRLPASMASSATLSAVGQNVNAVVDSASGGKYVRRLMSQGSVAARPATISVSQGAERMTWNLLTVSGAESTDPAWTTSGTSLDSTTKLLGRYAYRIGGGQGEVRSAAVAVPSTTDTVSLTFWTRYSGDGYSQSPYGLVRASTDSGRTWDVLSRMAGYAGDWYPEDVRIGGVRGKSLMVSFLSQGLPWWLDEVALFTHASSASGGGTGSTAARLLPSANPVRGASVTFTWPYGATGGRLLVYDITGRLAWSHTVIGGSADVTWTLGSEIRDGVYLVLAESAGAHARLKLFIARGTP